MSARLSITDLATLKRQGNNAEKKRSKYGAVRTDGYASKKEAKRAADLKALEAIGQIRNLRSQVSYELIPRQSGERACSYVADFVYDEPRHVVEGGRAPPRWVEVVEDCKGMRTDIYRLKRKLMLHVHGIRIRET